MEKSKSKSKKIIMRKCYRCDSVFPEDEIHIC